MWGDASIALNPVRWSDSLAAIRACVLRNKPFEPPSAALYRLQRIALQLSKLNGDAAKLKAREYFQAARDLLEREDRQCTNTNPDGERQR